MAPDHVRFTVKVLQPRLEQTGGSGAEEEAARTLAIGAKRTETFEELWQKVQARYNARYNQVDDRDVQIGELYTESGADIDRSDAVGSLYDETSVGEYENIYARITGGMVQGGSQGISKPGMLGAKRSADGDGEDQEQGSAKRRKTQLTDTVKGTVVMSELRDEDGFKIPNKKDDLSSEHRAPGCESHATVLVADSQAEAAATTAEAALSKLQQRKNMSTSSQASRSSPLAAVDAHRAHTSKAHSKPSSSHKAFPTPESHERQRPDLANGSDGPPSNGQKFSSWFKWRTPATIRSIPNQSFTQDDPIEDSDHAVNALPLAGRVPASSQAEAEDDGSHEPEGQATTGLHAGQHLKDKLAKGGGFRTPSAHRSASTQTGEHPARSSPHSSEGSKNTKRSVAHGWTKEEDDCLLEGLSARKGITVKDVLKEYGINRSASAARSRHRLLTMNLKDRQINTLDFPSSSLAMPQSESDEESARPSKKRKVKVWTQEEIGTLRKAIGEGLGPHEIQAKHFESRSEEAIMSKIREVQESVYRVEKRRDSFPNKAVVSHLWTDQHSLKLRRAYREGLNVVAAASRYFQSLPPNLVEAKMKAYRKQMEDSTVQRSQQQQEQSQNAANYQATARMDETEAVQGDDHHDEQRPSEQDARQLPEASQPQEDVDSEILQHLDEQERNNAEASDGPIIQDSYETGSGAEIPSSPPLMRKPNRRSSPAVFIPQEEQQDARQTECVDTISTHTQRPQLRSDSGSGGQMQLNFQRDKGKSAVRPVVDVDALDRRYSKRPGKSAIPGMDGSAEHKVIDVSSHHGEEIDDEDDSEPETSQPLPRLDGSSSIVKDKRRLHTSADDSPDSPASDSNLTVSSGGPRRQLTYELEQSMSAAAQSTQSQTGAEDLGATSSPEVHRLYQPTAFVSIPSPRGGVAASRAQYTQWQDSGDEDDAFQTQDPNATLSQQQKRAASRRSAANTAKNDQRLDVEDDSDDSTPAFQTQDPSTTLSQKRKSKPAQKIGSAQRAKSMLQAAVDRFGASQPAVQSRASASTPDHPASSESARKISAGSVKPRRDVYDIPMSSQSTGAGSQSQKSILSFAKSSSEKRQPGRLPRINGAFSKLRQRKKDAEKEIAARKAERAARSSSVSLPPVPGIQDDDDVEEIVRDNSPVRSLSSIARSSNGLSRPSAANEEPEVTAVEMKESPQEPSIPQTRTNETKQDVDSQSQLQPQPVIELPYPQIFSREPGPNGKVEAGRPGFTFKFHSEYAHLRTDEELFAAASRESKDEGEVARLVKELRLLDQQQVALTCSDYAKLRELKKVERRYRRERRVAEGKPPSRGPGRRLWAPGMPKGIEWDVDVMPDSDDSMSSRGHDMDDLDEEMAEIEEERSAEMDDEDNPMYFDRDRHFSEVEDEGEEEEEQPINSQHLIADVKERGDEPDERYEQHLLADVESDEEPLQDLIDLEAAESKASEDATSQGPGDSAVRGGVAIEGEDEEDEAELPTAPPPATLDSIDDAVAPHPSDRELQDLVQSGDAEVEREVDAPAFTETRSPPGLGSSPIGYPTLPPVEGAFTDDSLAPVSSFNPNDTQRSHENTAQYYRRRNASPNRNPDITDSMLPPWPSSGKVRSSLEELATQTPPVELSMASKHSQQDGSASSHGKKRKLEMTAEELADSRAARKAAKKERKAQRESVEKQKQAKDSSSDVHSSSLRQPVAKTTSASLPDTAIAPEAAAIPIKISRKQKKKDRQHSASHTNDAAASKQPLASKHAGKDDRHVVPPPALPPPQLQQSSLPSPDSEVHRDASGQESKAARKAAKKAAQKERRRMSSMSASVNESMTSDASVQLPVASSPPALTVAHAAVPSVQTPILPVTKQSLPEQVQKSVETPSIKPTDKKSKKKSKKLKKSADASYDTIAHKSSKTSPRDEAVQSMDISPSQSEDHVPKTSSRDKKKKNKSKKSPEPEEQTFSSLGSSKTANPEKEKSTASPAEQTSPSSSAKATDKTQPSDATAETTKPKSKAKDKVKSKSTKPAPVTTSTQTTATASTSGSGLKGLKDLMGFQPHIPDAPKPPQQQGPKRSVLIDDDTESESESSGDESD